MLASRRHRTASQSSASFSRLSPSPSSGSALASDANKRRPTSRLTYPIVICSLVVLYYILGGRDQKDAGVNKFSSNVVSRHGLLYFDEHAQTHPILRLVESARHEWSAKLNRQSKTLAEAVIEYHKRYGRAPPKGFDKWYAFARDNQVILVDEYDQIDRDIRPLSAIRPSELRARSQQLVDDKENYYHTGSFTFQIHGGRLEAITGPYADAGRARILADLVRPFISHLPDVNITTWVHDTPILHTSGRKRQLLRNLAAKHQFMKSPDLHNPFATADSVGWEAACPPGSPIHDYMLGIIHHPPSVRSFIQDHPRAMDICHHPEYLNLHSLTSNYNLGPAPVDLWPLFSMCKTQMYSDILITPLEQWEDHSGTDFDWERKSQNKLFWRGSTTGSRYDRSTLWRPSQRTRLNALSNQKSGTLSVFEADASGKACQSNHSAASLTSKFYDVAFTGEPVQCDTADGTCAAVKRAYHFGDTKTREEANAYKYLLDVDGNGWSGRMHRLMLSNSAVVKSTVFSEWYQDMIQPWVHYIPVKLDYSDLNDIMAFFIGTRDGNGHDALGKEIGAAGREWALKHWRWEDMQAYMFRLYLEYARIMNSDENGKGMDYARME